MPNTIEIDGFEAAINYDSDLKMFRGEFLGMNGGVDFYARDSEDLEKEALLSLKVFFQMCQEDGVKPQKTD
ncbi:MAG: type II toxin-antitoxin system HicB family antitoxin [Candidatus Omnitrophica bacterium]|nr:type II toxin-antitoxin system HicB family antitoxin [Candidatus Omnitrophota bacterium]